MARTAKKILEQSKEERFNRGVHALEGLENRILKACRENFMNMSEMGSSFCLTPLDSFKEEEPYLTKLHDKEYLLIPNEMFLKLLELCHLSYEERFCMQLEREIAKQMPRDFDDIWEVAINEIKKSKKGFLKIDPEWLVADIKKQHPNLFMRFDFEFQ